MLSTAEVICFVATKVPQRAREFYGDVLGLRLVSDDPFAMVFDANGVILRIAKVQELSPAKHTVLGWAVADLDAEIRSLRGRGVTFERFPGLPQDDAGVWVSPTGAQIAWFKDPDENLLSLTECEP